VFSDLKCTRETAASAPELTLSCSVKSIDHQIFVNFVRRRMMSSMYGNGRPIKLSYTTPSPCGRSDVSMEKMNLSCRLETTQSDGLKPVMTRPSNTAPPASKTTAVVIRDPCARARLLLSCTNVPLINWASPYHAGYLSQCSNRYAVRCLWLVPLLPMRSSVCYCVCFIEVIAPDVAQPYREPSFTGICCSSHQTLAYMCYRPCMIFSCVLCMSFSHFLSGFLFPPSSLRPSPNSCPLSSMSPVLSRRIFALDF